MLKDRIVRTIKFFDLLDFPLTLLELRQFLVAEKEDLGLDENGEFKNTLTQDSNNRLSFAKILNILDKELVGTVESFSGFYFLQGKKHLAEKRLRNYFFGIKREKLIKRYAKFLSFIPFVRGVGLAGSQAMGEQKEDSDIDLFVITDQRFMWLTRTLVTAYFEMIGKRRHGEDIANRFCLNHYVAGPKEITELKNFYTAQEYLKLRALSYPHKVYEFVSVNTWLKNFFPESILIEPELDRPKVAQVFLEKLFLGRFGKWAERFLRNWQLPKIRQEKFILVSEDELSFHPNSKQELLLRKFL